MSEWQRWKNIMKCVPFEEKRLAKWKPPYICQPKYDGVRCRAVPLDNGEFLLLSSEENIIFSVPHINEQLKNMPRVEFDGELYCHGMSFEEIISRTSRTVNLHSDYKSIEYHIFDEVLDLPQCARTIYLSNCSFDRPLVVSPFYICNNLDDIIRVYDDLINQGYEGIIVRHFEAPYERKRSTLVMKFKPKKEDSYEIEGYQEEIDKEGCPKNRLGAIVCRSGDDNLFNVGTGFNDDARQSLWDIREMLKGNSVKIKYQHITSGKNVPRFPVFVEIEWRT